MVDGVTLLSATSPAVDDEVAVTAAALLLPLIRPGRAPWPVDQVTLRGPRAVLILTPLGPLPAGGPVLAASVPPGGGVALLELRCRQAAAAHAARAGAPLDDGAASGEERDEPDLLDVEPSTRTREVASSLGALGTVTASSLRDAETDRALYLFLPPGSDVRAVGALAHDVSGAMRQAAEAGVTFRTAVLRSAAAAHRHPAAGRALEHASSPRERRPSRAWPIARSSTPPPPSARSEDRTMSIINYAKKEISFKIVYYGAGVVGKTVNLQYIHRSLPDDNRGNLISLATGDERTLFFDFLPVSTQSVRNFVAKFQLYTVPGQVYYNMTRKLVLRGVDGIVFVADSQWDRLQENLESFKNLEENLREYDYDLAELPYVIQYNKRDLPNVAPVEYLEFLLNRRSRRVPYFEAVAVDGKGVFDTLNTVSRMVLVNGFAQEQGAPR